MTRHMPGTKSILDVTIQGPHHIMEMEGFEHDCTNLQAEGLHPSCLSLQRRRTPFPETLLENRLAMTL
jgi:hypothetical protein